MNDAASDFAQDNARNDAASSRVASSRVAHPSVAQIDSTDLPVQTDLTDAPEIAVERAVVEETSDTAGVAPAFNLGGQAIIEGVMMRSPRFIGAAIRRGNGQIETRVERFHSALEKFPVLRLPFVRGVAGLFEMMIVGTKWLRWSGDLAMLDSQPDSNAETQNATSKNATPKDATSPSTTSSTRSHEIAAQDAPSQVPNWLFALTAVGSFGIGLGLFLVLPAFLALQILGKGAPSLSVSLVETVIKTMLFVAYVWLIGKRKHIRRLFEYHGAEHKVVHATEAGRQLVASQARDFPRTHPRCGTGFALLVILVSALFFAFLPTDIPKWQSILLRFALLPVVAGVSYETLKLTLHPFWGKFVQTLMIPGMWLQLLTTREPDDESLEVSCAAMKAVLTAEASDQGPVAGDQKPATNTEHQTLTTDHR